MSVNTWQDAEARAAILDGAAAEQPEAVRKLALSALARLAVDAANKQAMWQHAEARAAILDGAAAGRPEAVREQALHVLSNLAYDAANWQVMWQHAEARAVLVEGAAAANPEGVRIGALRALANLACGVANQQEMWEDDSLREAALAGAAVGQPTKVRDQACCALATLSELAVRSATFHEHDRVAALLTLAIESTELCAEALAQSHIALERLSDTGLDDWSGLDSQACLARRAEQPLQQRMAQLRKVWLRAKAPNPINLSISAESLVESMLAQVAPLPQAEVSAAAVLVSFAGQFGVDGGGPRRHCFTEFGKRLPDAPAGSPALCEEHKSDDYPRRIRQKRAAASTAGASRAATALLFKLTDAGNLVPSSAETLTARVGEADKDGPIVPTVDDETLERYRACGRVCGLALVNECPLGLQFAHYFVRAILSQPPSSIEELQSELHLEEPTNQLDEPAFVQRSLSEQGLDGVLTLSRQVTTAAPSCPGAPLAPDPETLVTNDNKELFLERTLLHKLVLTIAQQADAFRQGCEDVVGGSTLCRFSADELAALWGGNQLDDEALKTWQEHTKVGSEEVEEPAKFFWMWLQSCTPQYRARVLQFATGSTRLPLNLSGWEFTIGPQSNQVVIQPSDSNGLTKPTRLASTHACGGGLLDLPCYGSQEELAEGMHATIVYGGGGFGAS